MSSVVEQRLVRTAAAGFQHQAAATISTEVHHPAAWFSSTLFLLLAGAAGFLLNTAPDIASLAAAAAVAVLWLNYQIADSSKGPSSFMFTGQVWCGIKATYAFTSTNTISSKPVTVEHTPTVLIEAPPTDPQPTIPLAIRTTAQPSNTQGLLALPCAPQSSGAQASAPHATTAQPSHSHTDAARPNAAQSSAPRPGAAQSGSTQSIAPRASAAYPSDTQATVARASTACYPSTNQSIAPSASAAHPSAPQCTAPRAGAAQSYVNAPPPKRNRNHRRSRTPLTWNEFQAENGGLGWSKAKMSWEWKRYKARMGL